MFVSEYSTHAQSTNRMLFLGAVHLFFFHKSCSHAGCTYCIKEDSYTMSKLKPCSIFLYVLQLICHHFI